MGVVHLARDPQGRPVAIKVLHTAATDGDKARLRLAREVETMRRVRSPFVAEVLDADVTGEFPYIVTRYVPGTTLDEMVRSRGPLSGSGLRRLACGTAEALTAIHAAGVVHRDLKPGNVMLSDDRPVVIDFGIAQAGDATRLTQTGLVMGTPGYLAPEVIEGQPSSSASDVHSWGATMAFAATGRSPFGSGSYEAIFYRIVSGRPDLSGVPGPLVALLTAALATDPARRPPASWLSAQASALDLTAPGPALTTLGPNPTAVPNAAAAAAAANAAAAAAAANAAAAAAAANAAAAAAAATGRKAKKRGKQNRNQAYPAPKQAARDVADLLPPVGYPPSARLRPASAQAPAQALPPSPASAYGPWPSARDARALQRPQAQPEAARARGTMAGLAVMVTAVALTVMLPVAGLLLSLAVITLLRAADRAQSTLAVRRSVHGPRASDLLVVVVMSPLTVARALLTEALMAPLAFIVAAATYAVTVAVTQSLALPRAGAYASAAIVAWYGIGPGSRRPRRQLNRMAGALARTPLSAAVIALAVWALAVGVVIFALSQTPYYWPVMAPHLPTLHGWPFITSHLPRRPHLFGAPPLHTLLSSATGWLFRHA